jgi:hypothetical protein
MCKKMNMAEFLDFLGDIYLHIILSALSGSISIVSFIFLGTHKITACDNLGSSNDKGFMTLSAWIPLNACMSMAYTIIGVYFFIEWIRGTHFITNKHKSFIYNLLMISIGIHVMMIPINITGAITLFKYSTACAYSNTWLLTLTSLIFHWIDMGYLCIILILKSTTLCKKADAHIELA